MHGRTLKIGAGMLATAAIVSFVAPSSAFADYAPTSGDVVGVGSDTLQALGDFVSDGDYVGDGGFNSAGNKFKIVSIDATADANTRLAYGTGGANGFGTAPTTITGSGSSAVSNIVTSPAPVENCAPGTGVGIGTGNAATGDTTVADLPCVLAPSVVLRAGLSPEQRPNGSGAGFKLLNADTNSSTGKAIGNGGKGLVNFSRASSSQVTNNANFASVTVGTDTLTMLSASGNASNPTHVVPLTTAQLAQVYLCNTTNWSTFGGTAGTILPLLPQVGSGTRSTFLKALGNGTAITPGSCVVNVEENDPLAIKDSSDPVNAVEPMSGSRLNLFLGQDNTGASLGAGYFKDPTCPFNPTTSSQTGVAGTTAAPTQCQGTAASLVPPVKQVTGSGAFSVTRDLLIYFRSQDVSSPTPMEPGGTLNWVRTLFYNPCPVPIGDPNFGADGCSIDGTTGIAYGPGGAPYFATFAGQTDIAAAGVTPKYAYNGQTE